MVEGTEGLTYFDGSRFFLPIKDRFPKVVISGMAEDSDGGIWMATSGGVYRAFQEHLQRVAEGSAMDGMVVAAPDVFLVSLTKPISRSAELLRISRAFKRIWKIDAITSLTDHSSFRPDHAGNILYLCDGGYCEFRARDAVMWRSGGHLPVIVHTEQWLARHHPPSGVVLKDSVGCIWLKTEGNAQVHCPGDAPEQSEEIVGSGSQSILELNDGTVVLPFFNKLAIGRPGRLQMTSIIEGYPGTLSAVSTEDGALWLCNGNGVLFVSPRMMQMEFWTEREGLDGNTWSIVRTTNRTLAVAGEKMLFLNHDRSRWIFLKPDTNLNRFAINDGKAIGEGRPPVPATDNSAIERCSTVLASLGWNRILGLQQQQCVSVSMKDKSDLWYSHNEREGGFVLLENSGGTQSVLHNFDSGPNIGNATVRFFGVDSRGWIWRGSPIGIYVADPELARQGQWLYLNRTDGIAGTDANRGSFFSDPDGSVWFGLDSSIDHLRPPSDLLRPTTIPTVFISGYVVNDGKPKMAEMVTHIDSGGTVTALIGSLLYHRRNALRFRYRLLPEQMAWQETAGLDLVLGTLSAGPHTLEVQGRIFTGPWSPAVTHSFTVLRPVWLAFPFLLSYAAAAFAIPSAIVWLRYRRTSNERNLLPDLREWRIDALESEGHPLSGATMDRRYRVGGLLARGGFASVLAAYDDDERRPCAIKVFGGEFKNNVSRVGGFQQEIAALRKIRHPNVVAIYADGTTSSGAPYMVMEFIEGRNLRDILRDGALPRALAGRLLGHLAGALDAIHAQKICHRDVKPENIIVRDWNGTAQAVLIDFSIAIIKDVNETLHGISRAAGTFDYMAPEQALGYAQPSSDIFSLAKLIIEMLGGVRLSELLPNVALDLPSRVLEILSNSDLKLSEESQTMLARALEFDPSNRPQIASQFADPIVRDLTR
jgi:serine/threonine-protein kinase